MKLLIDIPDWLYQHIVDFGVLESDEPELYWAIYKGQKVLAEDIIKMKSLLEGLFPLFSRRKKGGLEMKLTTIDVPPYEESYPYNVLYDILQKAYEQETVDEHGNPIIINVAKEKLAEYDIYEFIKCMNNRLTDRELRCIECKYRYNMTLEETAKIFNVTRERIRQNLAKAERKLRARLYKCKRISAEEYDKLLNDHATMCQVYDKVMWLLEKIAGESPMSILEALDNHPILSKEIIPDPIDDLELSVRSYNCLKRAGFKSVKDIIDTDEKSENSEWIFKVRNLGRKSAEEIKSRLVEKYNYTLKAWRKSDI